MNSSPQTWVLRALWLTLPLTAGDILAGALDGRSGSVRATVAVLAWSVWAAGLLASLVARPVALTALRMLAPLPLVGSLAAASGAAPEAAGWIGLATAAAVAVLAMSAEVGAEFVDGASYGDERRVGLRPPGALLLGPIPLVWVLGTVTAPVGAVLLAARQWVLGAVLVVLGAGAAWWAAKVLHRLARRCVVFVPAGMTLVDAMVLAEPVLFRRSAVTRLGPAPANTGALDLSAGATGLIVQVDLGEPVSVVPLVARGATTEAVAATSVLIAPSRPGAFLDHAARRDLAVQRG